MDGARYDAAAGAYVHTPILSTEAPTRGEISIGAVVGGVVGAVTSFGTFVDVGWEKEGLIHSSIMQKMRRAGIKVAMVQGSTIKVRVVSLDKGRKRLGLQPVNGMDLAP
jgi:protein Tex